MKYIIITIFLLSVSCTQNSRYPRDFDQASIRPIHLVRFEKDLLKLDTLDPEPGIQAMKSAYPAMTSIFFENIMEWTADLDSNRTELFPMLKAYRSDSAIHALHQLVESSFSDEEDLIKDLGKTLALVQYYFPKMKEPRFYTLVSGFNIANFIFEDVDQTDGLGISLEFFLGDRIDYKQIDPSNPVFSNYISRTFNREHIQKKTWEVWVEDKLGPEPGNNLLDLMMHRGKKLYILSRILPEIQDSVLYEFNAEQLLWCKQNQRSIWAFFTGQKLLYETNPGKIQKYINPSPDSPGMPKQAPGQTGSFIGHQIIEAFMMKHPELEMSDLIHFTNAQKILDESKFRPKDE